MKILFFGDSNTWGYDAKDASRQPNRFTQLVKKAFSEHEIIEEGLCGRTLCLNDPYDEDRNGAKMISMVLKRMLPLMLCLLCWERMMRSVNFQRIPFFREGDSYFDV